MDILISSQRQVDGLNGLNGTSVLYPVGVVYNLVPGNVLERQNVKAMIVRVSYVMHIIAQVCGFSYH